jgi:hypothetical protein
MSTLQATINALAAEFANNILRALRNASLDELVSGTGGTSHTKRARSARLVAAPRRSGGRLHRRSEAQLEKVVEQIVSFVSHHANGVNAEAIKAHLKLQRKELPRPLGMALASKKIRKKGVKRATTYFKA